MRTTEKETRHAALLPPALRSGLRAISTLTDESQPSAQYLAWRFALKLEFAVGETDLAPAPPSQPALLMPTAWPQRTTPSQVSPDLHTAGFTEITSLILPNNKSHQGRRKKGVRNHSDLTFQFHSSPLRGLYAPTPQSITLHQTGSSHGWLGPSVAGRRWHPLRGLRLPGSSGLNAGWEHPCAKSLSGNSSGQRLTCFPPENPGVPHFSYCLIPKN